MFCPARYLDKDGNEVQNGQAYVVSIEGAKFGEQVCIRIYNGQTVAVCTYFRLERFPVEDQEKIVLSYARDMLQSYNQTQPKESVKEETDEVDDKLLCRLEELERRVRDLEKNAVTIHSTPYNPGKPWVERDYWMKKGSIVPL